MNKETHPLFSFQKSEVIIGGSVVLAVFFIGLISLGQFFWPSFRDDPCDTIFFRVVPIVAGVSFLFAIFWATTGFIRFVSNQTFTFADDTIHRSTYLAFLLPLLTILAILAGVAGFITVGIISGVLLIVSSLVNQNSFKANTLVVIGNIVLSFIAFGLSTLLLVMAGGMCAISRF